MHLIVIIQESDPGKSGTGHIDRFIKGVSEKEYPTPFIHSSWARIRPREIRFYDFTIPAKIEEEVVKDLLPYMGGKLNKLSKIISLPFVKEVVGKTLKIKPVDVDSIRFKVESEGIKRVQKFPVYLTIVGKVEDNYEDGIEQL
jgi:hypothetical protein